MKKVAGMVGLIVAIFIIMGVLIGLSHWKQNYAATHADTQNTSVFDARETITVHFLDTDRYVEFENAQIVYSGHERFLVTEDNQRIQIVNAEIIHNDS